MALRLGSLWFVLMAAFGCYYPYYSLYLTQVLGLSATQVGTVIAMQPLAGIFAQPLWGHLADRTGSRRKALALAIAGFALGAYGISQATTYPQVLLATAAFATCSTSLLSMSTAVSLAALPSGTHGFGRVRMFGTLGYLAAVVAFPWLAIHLAGHAGPERLYFIFALTALLAVPAVFLVLRLPPVPSLGLRASPGDLRQLLGHRPLRRIVVFAFFSNLVMQGPINLFPVLLSERGGGVEDLRLAWILMLLLEIPLVAFAGATLQKLGPRGLLAMGILGEGVRWTATAFVPSLAGTIGLQVLHGLSAMGVLIGVPLYLELCVPARLRSTGQTLVAAVGLGLGSVASSALGGFLFDRIGSFAPFLACGLVALALAAALYVFLPPPSRPADGGAEEPLSGRLDNPRKIAHAPAA